MLDLLKALLTPLIAIIALFIAYMQYRNAKYKVKMDLFDRRYEVYLLLGEIIISCIKGFDHDDQKGFQLAEKIRFCGRKSKFLFNKKITAEIQEILDKAERQGQIYRRLKPKEKGGIESKSERDQLSKEKRAIIKYLDIKLKNLEDIFSEQIKLNK